MIPFGTTSPTHDNNVRTIMPTTSIRWHSVVTSAASRTSAIMAPFLKGIHCTFHENMYPCNMYCISPINIRTIIILGCSVGIILDVKSSDRLT